MCKCLLSFMRVLLAVIAVLSIALGIVALAASCFAY